MTNVLVRIFLRYAAGALIAHGYLDQTTGDTIINDADLQIMLGGALMAISEGWYFLARKFGWSK
jgi:hypothetical protein